VKRATARGTRDLAERFGLGAAAAAGLDALLAALAAEPDPPTTIRDPAKALGAHLADSLEGLRVREVREARRIADIGAGAGFPGLPLAIALPGAEVDLVEAARRKCEVIERLAAAAGAGNARALPLRSEQWAATEGAARYDVVTARAVAGLPVLVEYAAPLLADGGLFVAWKGRRSADEERAGAKAAELLRMEPGASLRAAPFEGVRERHLHFYRKVGETPPGFPRRPGMAAKRPLA
jgi:16S rRNA (guanine527-N7)-methyltransferase